jgi:hypothetical protein
MLLASAASDLRDKIWRLRDHNLIFTLNAIEPQNLDRATELKSPYNELDDLLKMSKACGVTVQCAPEFICP